MLSRTLYLTTSAGGSVADATVFAVTISGDGFRAVYNLTGFPSDRDVPDVGSVASGDTLFGNTTLGDTSDDGPDFVVLHSFTCLNNCTNNDGAYLYDGLILSGNTLYCTTYSDGSFGSGTIFSLPLPVTPPRLTISQLGPNIILNWPTNAGFNLQSTPDLTATFTNIPNTTSPFANPITGPQTILHTEIKLNSQRAKSSDFRGG